MARSFPLRAGYFTSPVLSPNEEKEILEWARSLVPNLSMSNAEYSYSHEKNGVQISEDRQRGGLFYTIKGECSVAAEMPKLMDMITSTSTIGTRTTMKLLLRDHFLDAALLYQKERTQAAESLCIKWFGMKSQSPLTLDQDFCVLEYATMLPAEVLGGKPGETYGVCLYESIEQAECQSMLKSHKLERASISRCGYIFRPTPEKGQIAVQFVGSIRQPERPRIRRHANRSTLTFWAESLFRMQESINIGRISRLLSKRSTTQWVNDEDRSCCLLCRRAFSNLRRKHHCRLCGEVICGKCCSFTSVNLPTIGLSDLRICKACKSGAEHQPVANTEEYALALTNGATAVPDEIGVAWLKQLAGRDPEKRKMVESFVENLNADTAPDYGFGDVAANSQPEDIYDLLCDLASQALDCKFAVVSLIDENRQWFKSKVNISQSDIPRDFSFCEYPVRSRKPLVVMEALRDGRFDSNPFVIGPLGVRFLAGAPLFTNDGECVGSVCVMDTEPRDNLPPSHLAVMEKLANLAMVSMQERREADAKKQELHQYNKTNAPQVLQQQEQPAPAAYRREYEEQMMALLQKSHQTRQQVDQNQRQHTGVN